MNESTTKKNVINESHKHNTEEEKPDSKKRYTVYDFIYTKKTSRQNSSMLLEVRTVGILVCAGEALRGYRTGAQGFWGADVFFPVSFSL